jgi:hypothetical protein
LNRDMTVTGSLQANSFIDSDGNSLISKDTTTGEITLTTTTIQDTSGSDYLRKDSTTGAIHIGQNSMVFDDASGSIGNGWDVMSSSVGKIQIGKNSTDTTTFVGNVHVPDPTASTHAATKRYTDSIGAMSMAMASALTPTGNGNHIGVGTGLVDGQSAIAIGLGVVDKKTKFNFSIAHNPMMNNPTVSGGASWSF